MLPLAVSYVYVILEVDPMCCFWQKCDWHQYGRCSDKSASTFCRATNVPVYMRKFQRENEGADRRLILRIIDGLGLIRLFFWFPERCFWASSLVHVVSVQQVNLMARASQQNIFKIPTHLRAMAVRKGRGSEISWK